MINEAEMKDLQEVQRLLDEAYKHYFDLSDGYCKGSEGDISLTFGTYFDRDDDGRFGIRGVTVYSYVLGPDRYHDFETTAEALETIKEWHAKEMARSYEEDRCIPVEKLLNGEDVE